MRKVAIYACTLLLAACAGGQRGAPPVPTVETAPILAGMTVMVFPTQYGSVPVGQEGMLHIAIDRQKLDAELAYWLPQNARTVKWVLPEAMQRMISRSPTLDIDINNLAVAVFRQAQVKRVGDPLYGDLRRLAAVMNARLAVIPVAAEQIGTHPDSARVQVATAVIDAHDGNVIWFGIIESEPDARGAEAGTASAAQAMARAFGGRQN